jgi:predicted enzyme involved in methoxymalonyl-ACP biosynthesis
MQGAFPEMRVLGKHPYYLRRVLLWAPETQVAAISSESGRRTEMIQAQIERESQRKALSREEFLLTLGVRIKAMEIGDVAHPRFARAFELINKTNQFNTTGRRWTQEECVAGFRGDTKFYAFEVADKFTEYGLVAVVIAHGAAIEQMVMSCRVVGLGVEETVLAIVAAAMRRADPDATITARLVETDANLLCRNLYPDAGFTGQDGRFSLAAPKMPLLPVHVQVDGHGVNGPIAASLPTVNEQKVEQENGDLAEKAGAQVDWKDPQVLPSLSLSIATGEPQRARGVIRVTRRTPAKQRAPGSPNG